MFGRRGKTKAEKPVKAEEAELASHAFFGEYIDCCHSAYAKRCKCDIGFYSNVLQVQFGMIHEHAITIPYAAITDVNIEDRLRITKTRVWLTGISFFGLLLKRVVLWKSVFPYTAIKYTDEIGIKQKVAIDFKRRAEQAQELLYQKMLAAEAERLR